MKQEAAVLDPVTQEESGLTADERAAYRMGTRNVPAGVPQGPENRSFGALVKGLFIGLGRAIERAMDRNREFDHW